jgi:hypothetical protein
MIFFLIHCILIHNFSKFTFNGVVNLCVSGKCELKNEDCVKDINCLKVGLYYKCKNAKCEKSEHMICITSVRHQLSLS